MKDQNGKTVSRNTKQNRDGTWSTTVWSGLGVAGNPALNIRRHTYQTREQARAADISDNIGERGLIRVDSQ